MSVLMNRVHWVGIKQDLAWPCRSLKTLWPWDEREASHPIPHSTGLAYDAGGSRDGCVGLASSSECDLGSLHSGTEPKEGEARPVLEGMMTGEYANGHLPSAEGQDPVVMEGQPEGQEGAPMDGNERTKDADVPAVEPAPALSPRPKAQAGCIKHVMC